MKGFRLMKNFQDSVRWKIHKIPYDGKFAGFYAIFIIENLVSEYKRHYLLEKNRLNKEEKNS